jgi:hypothetical protein
MKSVLDDQDYTQKVTKMKVQVEKSEYMMQTMKKDQVSMIEMMNTLRKQLKPPVAGESEDTPLAIRHGQVKSIALKLGKQH